MQKALILIALFGIVLTPTTTVSSQPELTVTPDSLYAELFIGTSAVETLMVSNTGDFELVIDISILPTGFQIVQYQNVLSNESLPTVFADTLANKMTTNEYPPPPPVPTLTSRTLTPADFLVVDHGKDKTFLSSYTFELMSEIDLNTVTTNDLLQYEVLYFEPDWFNYNNLSDNMTKITEFVKAGGVVVINIAGNIGDGLGIAPLGTNYANYDGNYGGDDHESETITDFLHPYIKGEPYGGVQLNAADFRFWFSTDHGHLFNHPDSISHIVLNNPQGPSWLEYKLGKGYVIVTTLTYGWGLGGAKRDPLENLFKYSIHLAKTAWLSIDLTSGTLQPGTSFPLEVTIDSDRLVAGEHSAIILFQSNDPFTPNLEIPVVLQVSNYPCGDANGDLEVDNRDLDYMREAFFYCGPGPISLESVDFNCNEKLDLADVFFMERFFNELDSLVCCLDSAFQSK